MKTLKYILLGIAGLIVLFLVIAAIAPKHLNVERSVVINAPKTAVFQQVRTLRNMQNWSPWAERDPNMKLVYTGNDGEVGSSYTWAGNDEVGAGSQTLTMADDHRVEGDLIFKEPFESKAHTYVEVAEADGGTKAIWGFEQDMPYPMNGMCLFMDMDKMIGQDFEKGLNKLKMLAESSPAGTAASYNIEEIEMPAKTYITKREEVSFARLPAFFGKHYSSISAGLAKAKVEHAGPPSAVYYKWDEKGMKTDVAAGIPVADAKAKVAGYQTLNIPAGKALRITYYGDPAKTMDAHMAIDKYMKEKDLKNAEVVEEYVTDPGMEKDTAKWQTNIYYMIKS